MIGDISFVCLSYSKSCSINFIAQLQCLPGLNIVIPHDLLFVKLLLDTLDGVHVIHTHVLILWKLQKQIHHPSYEGGSPLRYLCLLIHRCNNNLLGDNCMNNINIKYLLLLLFHTLYQIGQYLCLCSSPFIHNGIHPLRSRSDSGFILFFSQLNVTRIQDVVPWVLPSCLV